MIVSPLVLHPIVGGFLLLSVAWVPAILDPARHQPITCAKHFCQATLFPKPSGKEE